MMIPGDLIDRVNVELLALSDALLAVDAKWNELGPEARMIWLDAQMFKRPAMRELWEGPTGPDLRRAIGVVAACVRFVENWSDCARSGSPREDDDWTEIEAAGKQGANALKSVLAIVDYIRAGRG